MICCCYNYCYLLLLLTFLQCAIAAGAATTGTSTDSTSKSTSTDNFHDPTLFFGGQNNEEYLEWWETRGQTWFSHSLWMPTVASPEEEGVALHWSLSNNSVNDEAARIHVAVVARIAATTSATKAGGAASWVGFGLAENGGMRGADVFLWSSQNPTEITDAHILDALLPVKDECQNWQLDYSYYSASGQEQGDMAISKNSEFVMATIGNQTDAEIAEEEEVAAAAEEPIDVEEEYRFVIVEATRLLDTGDPQDRKIIRDDDPVMQPTKIIAAWGISDNGDSGWSYHGPHNRAQSSVRFFNQKGYNGLELFREKMEEEADGWFFVGAEDFLIPSDGDTWYQAFCYNITHVEEQGVPAHLGQDDVELHIIGYEPWIDERARKYVHHLAVVGTKSNDTVISERHVCASDFNDGQRYGESQLIYNWATGHSEPTLLPENVSFPMEFFMYSMDIHYNNVDLDEGKFDSSGVKIYYTRRKKPLAAGVMPVGDPMLHLQDTPLITGYSKNTFSCPAGCTSLTFEGDKPITVYAERYHMHQTAVRATSRVLRDGQVVHSSQVDFWDFEQNGGLLVQGEPFVIKPGDELEATCYFNSPTEDYTWGEASQEEMCIVYYNYYPRQTIAGGFNAVCNVDLLIPQCSAELESTALTDAQELGRGFGVKASEKDVCPEFPLEYERETVAQKQENENEASNGANSGSDAKSIFTNHLILMIMISAVFLSALH